MANDEKKKSENREDTLWISTMRLEWVTCVCLHCEMMAYYCHCVTENVLCFLFNAFRVYIIHQNHFHCENLEFLWHALRCSLVISCARVFAFQPQIGLASSSFIVIVVARLTNGYKQFSFSHIVSSAISLHLHSRSLSTSNLFCTQWKRFIVLHRE